MYEVVVLNRCSFREVLSLQEWNVCQIPLYNLWSESTIAKF